MSTKTSFPPHPTPTFYTLTFNNISLYFNQTKIHYIKYPVIQKNNKQKTKTIPNNLTNCQIGSR